MGRGIDARGYGGPLLVLLTGLPGTGKSTVAGVVGRHLDATVLGHDWVMSGLRPYPAIQVVLDSMEPSGHGVVGWSIMNALARAQLRHGRSVVLDGVARAPEIEQCRETAVQEVVPCVVVATRCSDGAAHRRRIEGRRREIPDWYEVEWDQVERSAERWTEPQGADLHLDTVDGEDVIASRVESYFGGLVGRDRQA
jgi:predicted kinase